MSKSSSPSGLNASLAVIRLPAYAILAHGLLDEAMYRGVWCSEIIVPFEDNEVVYKTSGDVLVGTFHHQIVLFAALAVILPAALGGQYETLLKKLETKGSTSSTGREEEGASSATWFKSIHNIEHYTFRPLGQGSL